MQAHTNISSEIWEACKRGDKSAYAIVYRDYFPKLYNYGKKITEDVELIEDCIQDIFSNFWFSREKLEHVKEIQGYLFISFRNNLLRQLARTKKDHAIDLSGKTNRFDLNLSVDHIMINKEQMYEQRVKLENVIAKLTPRQREVIFFRYYEDMSYDQIAHMLGISTKATYKLVARAIIELRKAYQQKMVRLVLSLVPFLITATSIL